MRKFALWLFVGAFILVGLFVLIRKPSVPTTANKASEQERTIDAQRKALEMTSGKLGADISQSKQKEIEAREKAQEEMRRKMQPGK